MTDIDTLRRYERALDAMHDERADVIRRGRRAGIEQTEAYVARTSALTWALDQCRAEIAKAEQPPLCAYCRTRGAPRCSLCDRKGTGKKP